MTAILIETGACGPRRAADAVAVQDIRSRQAETEMGSEKEQSSKAERDPHRQRFGKDLRSCVACGSRGLFHPFYLALKKCGTERSNLHLVKEFNCESWTDILTKTHSLPELWGKGLSLASGIKLGQPDATVVLATQASYFFMEGGGAFLQTASKNSDLTCVILDSQWKLPQGSEREEGEWGSGIIPLNPIALLLLSGATFVAQVHSDRVEEAAAIIELAIRHTGFSTVYIVTSDPLYHPERDREAPSVQKIEEISESHPVRDQTAALALATRGDGRLRTGIFYRIDRPISGERKEAMGEKEVSSAADWGQLLNLFKP